MEKLEIRIKRERVLNRASLAMMIAWAYRCRLALLFGAVVKFSRATNSKIDTAPRVRCVAFPGMRARAYPVPCRSWDTRPLDTHLSRHSGCQWRSAVFSTLFSSSIRCNENFWLKMNEPENSDYINQNSD